MSCHSSGQAYSAGGGGATVTVSAPSITKDAFVKGTPQEQIQAFEDAMSMAGVNGPYTGQGASGGARDLPGSADKYDPVSQLMYTLGYQGKPEVLSYSAYAKAAGKEVYRVVNASGSIGADDIAHDMMTSELTRISGSGQSVHGAGLYFGDSKVSASHYGKTEGNVKKSAMISAKIKQGARIADESALFSQFEKERKKAGTFAATLGKNSSLSYRERITVYAMSKGYDGLFDNYSGYAVIYNRGVLAIKQNPSPVYK